MSAVNIMIQLLLSKATVTAITSTRIEPYPLRSNRPGIAVSLVSEVDGYKMDGSIGYPRSRVSVHCIAESATVADSIAEAVKLAIQDHQGTVLTKGVTIFKSGSDYSDFTDDMATFRRVSDYEIRWR